MSSHAPHPISTSAFGSALLVVAGKMRDAMPAKGYPRQSSLANKMPMLNVQVAMVTYCLGSAVAIL